MTTKNEKAILEYVYTQAENCMAFLRENDLVGEDAQVGFTVSRQSNYVDVTITYHDKKGCKRIVSRTSTKWTNKAQDRVLVVRK